MIRFRDVALFSFAGQDKIVHRAEILCYDCIIESIQLVQSL